MAARCKSGDRCLHFLGLGLVFIDLLERANKSISRLEPNVTIAVERLLKIVVRRNAMKRHISFSFAASFTLFKALMNDRILES